MTFPDATCPGCGGFRYGGHVCTARSESPPPEADRLRTRWDTAERAFDRVRGWAQQEERALVASLLRDEQRRINARMDERTGAPLMPDHKTLAQALVAFQSEAPQVKKDKTAHVRSDKGNYSYTYADLADMVAAAYPVLSKHGLAFTSKPTLNADGRFVLAYRLWHGPSGETDEGEIALPSNGTPQAIGAATTYARRQAFSAVTGIVADEDNDANDGGPVQYSRKTSQNKPAESAEQDTVQAARSVLGNRAKALGVGLDIVDAEYQKRAGRSVRDETDPKTIRAFIAGLDDGTVTIEAAS